MELRRDFVELLGPDISGMVFGCLDGFADVIRASAVSRTWRRFVIENGFCKKLILRLYPETSAFVQVVEVSNSSEPITIPRNSDEMERLEKEHRIYAFLSQYLNSHATSQDCILETITASSTDNYPDESIEHTLVKHDIVNRMPSYWSSKGAEDPQVPESLTYRLISSLCIIDQINVAPFKAYFQIGNPIYSAQAVRFRMGHLSLLREINDEDKPAMSNQSSHDACIWTYISPIFPMIQDNTLQNFKLPRPVLCTGGILQIELLGRVQQQAADGLYYICVSHVQVLGRALPRVLNVDHFDNSEQLALKYSPRARNFTANEASENEQSGSSVFCDADGRGQSGQNSFAESILGIFCLAEDNTDDLDDELA